METFHYFKGYGIRYFMGVTTVEKHGTTLRMFNGFPELAGRKKAENYINLLTADKNKI